MEEKIKKHYEKIIAEQKQENEKLKEQLMAILHSDVTYMRESQQSTNLAMNKSVDALTFLMTKRRNAPELKKITQENAQILLTHEPKLYESLLHYNSENKLDQYVGNIILKHIKKEDPDEQSVWNSDVSRLTYLIREIVNEAPTWLRDPNGIMFNDKIIVPVIDEITKYLRTCINEKNQNFIDSVDKKTDATYNMYVESTHMRQCNEILGTTETLRSQKFRNNLSEYIASHVSLHKLN